MNTPEKNTEEIIMADLTYVPTDDYPVSGRYPDSFFPIMASLYDSEDGLIEMAFACGDCWHLARALADTYDVEMIYLADEEDNYVHVVVYDSSSDRYIDVFGPQTLEQVTEHWKDHKWSRLYPEPTEIVDDDPHTRDYPFVSIASGVALVETKLADAGITLPRRRGLLKGLPRRPSRG